MSKQEIEECLAILAGFVQQVMGNITFREKRVRNNACSDGQFRLRPILFCSETSVFGIKNIYNFWKCDECGRLLYVPFGGHKLDCKCWQ
eukprot:g1505.t1